jgi:uncharacterized protein YdhG (YjbR/CyaY superfamily)
MEYVAPGGKLAVQRTRSLASGHDRRRSGHQGRPFRHMVGYAPEMLTRNTLSEGSTCMDGEKAGFGTIDEYIARFPADVRAQLATMRATIRAAAPEAEERISYQMPAFALHGNLVYFAALKRHIGFYPTSSGVAAFQDELAGYESSKGAIRFPIDQPLPVDLITSVVRFRVAENQERAAVKRGG